MKSGSRLEESSFGPCSRHCKAQGDTSDAWEQWRWTGMAGFGSNAREQCERHANGDGGKGTVVEVIKAVSVAL